MGPWQGSEKWGHGRAKKVDTIKKGEMGSEG